jgi:hypothetical protein
MKNLQERAAADAAPKQALSKADLLAEDAGGLDSLRAVGVPTPEWKAGTLAYVAELSGNERDELEVGWADYKASKGEEDNVGFRAWCVAFCLCDEQRGLLFDPDEVPAAAEKIGKKNGKATSRLFNTISRINGLTKADIDVLEGNSEATPPENAAGSGESPSV